MGLRGYVQERGVEDWGGGRISRKRRHVDCPRINNICGDLTCRKMMKRRKDNIKRGKRRGTKGKKRK